MNFKTIAFDADDTLWVNEPYFDEAEQQFIALFEDYLSKQSISQKLFEIQIKNLPLYGYGIKGYTLSMIEAANDITSGTTASFAFDKIIKIGQDLLQKPIELLEGITDVLQYLQGNYKLIVATKGDLKDQHRKLHLSGLGPFFHHIEVMVEKERLDYEKMLNRLDIQSSDFLMIGNSLKSDVLPVLEIGGTAVHVPYHTTWAHERIDHEIVHRSFYTVTQIDEIIDLLAL